jgi:hypothetical protein
MINRSDTTGPWQIISTQRGPDGVQKYGAEETSHSAAVQIGGLRSVGEKPCSTSLLSMR